MSTSEPHKTPRSSCPVLRFESPACAIPIPRFRAFGIIHQGRPSGLFDYVFHIPPPHEAYNTDDIVATFQNGVLSIISITIVHPQE